MPKRLPKGRWTDTRHSGCKFIVLRYESRSKVYRIRYVTGVMRGVLFWAAVEEFGLGKRYEPPTQWDHLLANSVENQ